MNDSMQLKWRVVPPSVSAGTVNPAVAASADGLLLFVASASDQKGSTDILVWDVEERSLFKQVSVPLDSVDSLHVLESDEEGSVSSLAHETVSSLTLQLQSLLLRSHSTLHHLTIPLYNDEHSIHLVREGVQQVVSVEGGRIFLLMKDGKLEMLPLGSLLRVEVRRSFILSAESELTLVSKACRREIDRVAGFSTSAVELTSSL